MDVIVSSAVNLGVLRLQRRVIEHAPALPVASDEGFRLESNGLQPGLEPQCAQDLERVGADLNARADFAETIGLLTDFDLETRLRKRVRGRQTAKATSDDDDFQRAAHGFGTPASGTAKVPLATAAMSCSSEARSSAHTKASERPARRTRASHTTSRDLTARMNDIDRSTVATGRKPPKAAAKASTMVVSAMAVMAWPETMPPTRDSLALARMRVVTASFSTLSIVRPRSWTHGANISTRMAARSVFARPVTLPLSDVMEALLAAGHGKQARRRNEPVAASFRQSLAFLRKLPSTDAVDIGQHSAVMGRERPAEHRAEIGVGWVRDDAV